MRLDDLMTLDAAFAQARLLLQSATLQIARKTPDQSVLSTLLRDMQELGTSICIEGENPFLAQLLYLLGTDAVARKKAGDGVVLFEKGISVCSQDTTLR